MSMDLGFLSAIVFAIKTYKGYLQIKLPVTRYLFIASLYWCIITAIFGFVPLFFPKNFEFWKIADSIAHIFVAILLAYLCRFFLALVKSPQERISFWIILVAGQTFTLIDFVYPRAPYMVPPGVIVWNNHPIVGVGFGVLMSVVISLLVVYFFTKKEVKSFLVKLRLLLFGAFFGLLGFGGIIITVFTNPLLVLMGDILIMIGALAMLSVSLVRYFIKTDMG